MCTVRAVITTDPQRQIKKPASRWLFNFSYVQMHKMQRYCGLEQ